MVLKDDGKVYGWGFNDEGQVFHPSRDNPFTDTTQLIM
jgi:alpha-tubulin suppressor-like RCC1 family protein